jgi:putative spermidine/putrescine transport system substrate-binding protein
MGAIMREDSGRSQNATAGPAHLVDLSRANSDLPSAPSNLRRSLPFDASFWIRQGNAIEKLFSLRMKSPQA